MKITHNETGQQYQLYPDTELEIERTNPFFNEWGEQSLPVDLPDTDQNRKLTGYAHLLGNKTKPNQRIPVKIEDGDYVMQARQAVLGATKKKSISTSFYMNEGAFYDVMPETRLIDIFLNEVVEGLNTVEDCLSFCSSLLTTTDERFAIFPILIDGDDAKKYINRLAWMDSSGTVIGSAVISGHTTTPQFYNRFEREEVIDDAIITIPVGYYISPFIKAKYLLKRIFQYFGYVLEDSFFTQEEPFSNMVFLNKTVDTLVNGVIKIADVVPDCTCSTILDVFRKKFDCEFIPDEVTKTVRVVLFKTSLSAASQVTLTDRLVGEMAIEYPDTYKQIKLTSEEAITDSASDVSTYDSVSELMKTYPTTVLRRSNMSFYRIGYTLGLSNTEKLATSSLPYADDETLELQEVTVPDCQPVMVDAPFDASALIPVGTRTGLDYLQMLYVGKGNYLNSTISYDNSTEVVDVSSTSNDWEEQKPMLAFYYDATGYGYIHGTISSYNYLGNTKLWNYSLCYFGEDGLFERFYRPHDDLLRNSLHLVRASMLLSTWLKRTLPSHAKVNIKGHELLINNLKYKVGAKNDPEESEFFTTQLYEPVNVAQSEAQRLAPPAFKWQVANTYVIITEAEFESSEYKDKTYSVFYPPHPTQAGGVHYPQYTVRKFNLSDNRGPYTEYRLYTHYLTGVLNT